MVIKWCVLVAFFLSVHVLSIHDAKAAVEVYEFGSDERRQRYHTFLNELRCPKCQNQSLSGSNSPIAQDLRREVHSLLEDGKSDAEIVDFMVARYGDYVLYEPKLEKKTWLLWFGPAGLLLLGAGVVFFMVARRARAQRSDGEGRAAGDLSENGECRADNHHKLSDAEQEELQRILNK